MSQMLVETAFETIGQSLDDCHDFPPTLYRIDPNGDVQEMVRGEHYQAVLTAAQVGASLLSPVGVGDLLALSYAAYAAPRGYQGLPSQCPERKEVRVLLAVDGRSRLFVAADDPIIDMSAGATSSGPVVDGLRSTMQVLRSIHDAR